VLFAGGGCGGLRWGLGVGVVSIYYSKELQTFAECFRVFWSSVEVTKFYTVVAYSNLYSAIEKCGIHKQSISRKWASDITNVTHNFSGLRKAE